MLDLFLSSVHGIEQWAFITQFLLPISISNFHFHFRFHFLLSIGPI